MPEPSLDCEFGPSALQLRGHLDPRQPRAINNLVVQLLGLEEVLAVARDDGDVEITSTRHIFEAISRNHGLKHDFDIFDRIRPLWQTNVGNSAWGLAIHTESRTVAVSSNNHEFNIFSFALAGNSNEVDVNSPPQHGQRQASRHNPADMPNLISDRTTRWENRHTRIKNGAQNIPHIAFCNTGDDPSGRWLLTTDISGLVQSWDLHVNMTMSQPAAHQTVRMGSSGTSRGDYDTENAGWGVMFLDQRACRKVVVLTDGYGSQAPPRNLEPNHPIWDLSSTRDDTIDGPYRSASHALASPVSDGDYASAYSSLDTVAPANLDLDINVGTQSQTAEDLLHITAASGAANRRVRLVRSTRTRNALRVSVEADARSGLNLMENRLLNINIKFSAAQSLCEDLPCPILHTSVRNIYLFQPPSIAKTATDHIPIILLANPMRQEMELLPQFDRCNMHAQIPSLGVVIIGSQKGRVVVLSLTRISHHGNIEMSKNQRVNGDKDVLALRLDHMLPLASQERAGHRPNAPLHGIAVGPLQGTEHLAVDQQRWRLMLMYQEHTVLSYEIGKDRDGEVDVRDVMI